MTCVFTSLPHSNFFVGHAAKVALAYSSAVIALNVTLSTLICSRLLWRARAVETTLGPRVVRRYTSAAALVVEGALPYTLFGIAYVVTLGTNSPTSILFLSLYVMFTVSASALRVRMHRDLTLCFCASACRRKCWFSAS